MKAVRALDYLISRFSVFGVVVAAVSGAAQPGCSSKGALHGGSIPEPEGTSQKALNSNPQTPDFALYAQNSASLGDRVEVHGGDVGVMRAGGPSTLVTGYELEFSSEARIDTDKNVLAYRLQLWDHAVVGDVQVNALNIPHQNATAQPRNRYSFPANMPALPPPAPVSPGTTALNVTTSTPIANPGSYGAVSVGHTITWKLRPGIYHLASLFLDNDARIEVLGPVQLRIAGRLFAFDRASIVPAAGVSLTAGDLRIEVSGQNGASGSLNDSPKSVKFGNYGHVSGVMLVPNGTLEFGANAILNGAYLARDIRLDNESKVYYQSGVGELTCSQPCDDGQPCTVDTCSFGVCTHTNAPAGTSCSDKNACNGLETCNGSGQCLPGTPQPPCQAFDQCHEAGTCDSATGQCSNPAKADGFACNDGQESTEGDVCTMGRCQGTKACAPVADVSAGGTHTCAVRGDGSLWCWGRNDRGQLGVGNLDDTSDAVRAGSELWRWSLVSTGAQHTCGIRIDSTLWCWGDNTSGQLGDGTTVLRTSPVQVDGTGWLSVRAGKRFTCGVTSAGAALCWGDNSFGNLGNGSQDHSLVPVDVVGSNWTGVAVGYDHACGIQGDTSLWCWGGNGSGQLGDGTTGTKLNPVQVSGTGWTSATAGSNEGDAFTCATRLNGSLWCWGSNSNGQLGLGTQRSSNAPLQVGTQLWLTSSAGGSRTSGVSFDGTLWSWGKNDLGQLGDGTQIQRLSPVRVLGNGWAQVTAGETHSCGRRQDGSLWCWGDNANGAVKSGGEVALSPTQVTDQLCATVPICGNGGDLESQEECDDGNNDDGDGCSWDCKLEKCFGVVCDHQPSNQCEASSCDPTDGQCKVHPKPDGTECNDGNACTQTDICKTGQCTGGNEKVCQASDPCHGIGVCDRDSGICSDPPIDKVGCNIHLRVDGVVNMGDGTFRAIFGYSNDSSISENFHPGINRVVLKDTGETLNPTPPPPSYLERLTHIGAFLPVFQAGQTIEWQVDDEHVEASEASPQYPPHTTGTGQVVDLGGGLVVTITPDLSGYLVAPKDPGPHKDLPTGDPFKGTLSGQLAVSPTGAAVYTLPILMPPGLAGMAPNLSLIYNSQGGDGIAGQGWELGGLSVIHRCPKTKVQDGYAQTVKMDGSSLLSPGGDGVCLDGKRIFPATDRSFNTEVKDFSSIELSKDEETFWITTKTGEIRTYGLKEDARIQLPLEDSEGNLSTTDKVIAIWALDRVEDQRGNYYDIYYDTDPINHGLLVKSIGYTGHVDRKTGHQAWNSMPYSIDFDYEPRPDSRRIRFRHSVLTKSQRLKSVKTDRGTYTLIYKPDKKQGHPDQHSPLLPSRLERISYCSKTDPNACMQDLVFEWEANNDPMGRYGWKTSEAYKPPVSSPFGIQFVDLDADGLVDILKAYKRTNTSSIYTDAWRNTGTGWESLPNWKLPDGVLLSHVDEGNGNPTFEKNVPYGTVLADLNGDGLPDLITDKYEGEVCDDSGSCEQVDGKPAVWINHLRGGGGWIGAPKLSGNNLASLFSGKGLSKLDLTKGKDMLSDIDGDGNAELVRFASMSYDAIGVVYVAHVTTRSSGLEWYLDYGGDKEEDWTNPSGYLGYSFLNPAYSPYSCSISNFTLRDVNRDGLPDIVAKEPSCGVLLNKGGGSRYLWEKGGFPAVDLTNVRGIGDIDGDGVYDSVTRDDWQHTRTILTAGFVPAREDETGHYTSSLKNYTKETDDGDYGKYYSLAPGEFELVDLNADGLVDVVANHRNAGGQALVNTGTNWEDIFGWSGYDDFENAPAPDSQAVPSQRVITMVTDVFGSMSTFIDVNGDGLPDRMQILAECEGGWQNGYCQGRTILFQSTALNTFQPPRITGFPSGQALRTQGVTYRTITTNDGKAVYLDSNALTEGTKYSPVPMTVVSSLNVPRGEFNSYAKTEYRYEDLRASAKGRGPQGFGKIRMTAPDGTITATTYGQAFPYTGLPVSVVKENKAKDGVVSRTVTDYCDNLRPAGNVKNCTPLTGRPDGVLERNVFVYPLWVTDNIYSFDSDGQPSSKLSEVTTTTGYVYDDYGNPTSATTTTVRGDGEAFRRIVENDYGADNGDLRKRGKATKTTVTSARVLPNGSSDGSSLVKRFAAFEYGDKPTYDLIKKKTLLAAGGPIAAVTAFHYDMFGNVDTTTNCASAFEDCEAGAEHAGDPNDPNDPAFRTTYVSYDPSKFELAPAGMTGVVKSLPLPYYAGWYPVKTTNALGHVQYTAYDPLLGVVIQSTGPNGVQTCYGFDALGYQISETARCGSGNELTSTTERYLIPLDTYGFSWFARTLTITKHADGGVSGAYADELGRTIKTFASSLDAELTYTSTEYDEYGRVKRVSKPSIGDTPKYWTETSYDWLSRVDTVTQDVFDPGDKRNSVTTTYSGWEVETTQTVNGEVRKRTERKNVLGKTAEVEDADRDSGAGNKVKYVYDAEGNLTNTIDPTAHGLVLTYDALGRKHSSSDPDLGTWTYSYNGFGELTLQTANGKSTKMFYDGLGRMVSRTDDQGTAEWVYDKAPGAKYGKLAAMVSAPNPKLNGACQIPFVTQTSGNRAGRWFTYNEFGDLTQSSECVDGKVFVADYSYDEKGRQKVVTYPEVGGSRFSAEYHYTQLGFLQYVADPSSGHPYWVARAMNAAGQITDEYTRNGVETTSDYGEANGWLKTRQVIGNARGRQIADVSEMTFDEVGNLLSRSRENRAELADATEIFTYDKLDRLSTAQLTIASQGYDMTEGYAYDSLGNLTSKGGKTYTYSGCYAGPHAVCQVGGGPLYRYDSNGNMILGNGRSIDYNSANKPTHIVNEETKAIVDFAYGADGHRVVQSVGRKDDSVPLGAVELSRTQYVGLGATGKSIYERTTSGGTIEHVHFLYAGGAHGGSAFAVYVVKDAPSSQPPSMKYNHFDHLGSVIAMTDEYGEAIGPQAGGPDSTLLAYDAWGARRNPDGNRATTPSFNLQAGHREYTGHETIPNVGLVNMNGRVYDPNLGRFLTPDPNVQFVANLQSFNRYSYVSNNPLRYTDPTGYFFLTSNDFWAKAIPMITGAVACSNLGACIAYGVAMTALYSTAAIASGAAYDQVLGSAAVGVLVSSLAIGAGNIGTAVGGSLVGGVLSVAASAGFSTMLGKGSLGENLLATAISSAMTAGIGWSLSGTPALSEASAEEQQGDYPESYQHPKPGRPGAQWDWAKGKTDALFSGDHKGLSAAFIKHVQTTFDAMETNVDLSEVNVHWNASYNHAIGYDVFLTGNGNGPTAFESDLSDLLHELGHVIQFENLSCRPACIDAASKQMALNAAITAQKTMAELNGNEMMRYAQPVELRAMDASFLVKRWSLLNPNYTLEAQAERFSDLMYSFSTAGAR